MKKKLKENFKEVDSLLIKDKEKARLEFEEKFKMGRRFNFDFLPNEEELRNLVRFNRPKWESKTSDNDLIHFICEKMLEFRFLQENDVKISVHDGVVGIDGEITSKECEKIIEELVLSVPGVVRIENKLKITKTSF